MGALEHATSTLGQGRHGRRSRRTTIVAAGLGAALVLLAACSGSGGGGGGGKANGTLKEGVGFSSQFSGTFDTATSKSNCDALLMEPIYGKLIGQDATGKLQPGLVQSWDVSARAITLHLRPHLTFQDDTPFDANAVKAGILHNKHNTDQLTSIQHVATMDVVNATTLRLNLMDETSLLVLNGLTGRDGYIIASNSLNSADKHPVGAGPYKFVSYTPDSGMTVKKWSGNWDATSYKIGTIDFTQVGVGNPSVTALEAGDVASASVLADGYDVLKSNPRYKVVVQPSTAYLRMYLRLSKPFDDVRVRQAIEHAIDRKKVNDIVNRGQGEVASQQYPKASPAYNPDLANLYPFDPAKARQLLAAAGYPNGVDIKVVIPGGNISTMEQQAALVQQMLADVGIRMSILRVNGADIATGYFSSRTGNAFLAATLGDFYQPNQLWDNFGRAQFIATFDDAENPQISTITEQAFAATTVPKMADLVKQGEKIVIQQALDVPIAFMPQFTAYDTQKVGGTVRAQTDICNAPDLRGMTLKG